MLLRLLRHGYGIFDRTQLIGPAEWPHHDLFFVHAGEVTLEFPQLSRRVAVRRGQGVLIWPRTLFRGQATSATVRASIQHFAVGSETDRIFQTLVGQKQGFSLQSSEPSRILERDVDRALALSRTDAPAVVRHALLALILAEGEFGPGSSTPRRPTRIEVGALATWLSAQLPHNPGVPELAACCGLSPSRFRTVFLAEHGRTAGEFIRGFREQEARRLLAETRLPLKAIAAALGYADTVVFHRAFQHRVQLTPASYRRKHRVHG